MPLHLDSHPTLSGIVLNGGAGPYIQSKNISSERSVELQIPPLRYASVGMTKESGSASICIDGSDGQARSFPSPSSNCCPAVQDCCMKSGETGFS